MKGGFIIYDLELIKSDFRKLDLVDKESFVENYKEFLIRDTANGHPSGDTKATYFSAINIFLKWCDDVDMNPLDMQEYHLKIYRDTLWSKNLKVSTIALKLTAIRKFFDSAINLKLIQDNPANKVYPGRDPDAELPMIKYLTAGQLEYLIRIIPYKEKEEYFRDRLMIIMMGIEGLRTVEINRMCTDDIQWEMQAIMIRGKGKNAFIYPREDVMNNLRQYIMEKEDAPTQDEIGIPVFTVVSNNNKACRISRQSIRKAIDYWFEQAEIKAPGLSCHLLRHSCGTLLYAESKDLQVVKETLRHKDLKMSSKYAHLQNRNLNRYTNAIPVKFN